MKLQCWSLSFLVLALGSRDAQWVELPCPAATASESCSYRNTAEVDMAVSLFFQFEDTKGVGSFQCTSGEVVHCARSWTLAEQGSAGTCFFLLGASQTFECSGQGTVNMIGAHGTKLAGAFLGSSVTQLPCKGPLDTSCSYENKGTQDEWVSLSFSGNTDGESLACTLDREHQVCSFRAQTKGDISSCSLLLAAGSELSCSATEGSPEVNAATAMSLGKQMSPLGSKVAICPAESTNTTFCDCSFENPSKDADLFVVINAKNEDGAFNSFHCYVGGANICAWGVNNGEQGSMGQCSFLLPAGASYTCQMEWGATAFPHVTALPLATSIFPASSSSVANPSVRGVAHVPASRPETELRRLFSEFQTVHGPVAPERFEQFSQFVALADAHPTNQPLRHGGDLSSLATLSREEFENSYRNCATLEDIPATSKPWTVDVNVHNTPTEVDWRKHGAVTPVKDQGQCGSCWTFSTTGVLEGAWAVAGQGLTQLSEQELVSCDDKDGNAGCGGGWPWKAVDYVHKNGIDTEASYPYSSGSGTAPSCTKSSGTPASIQVLDHSVVESDEEVMAAWVAKNGPLSVSVDAMTNLWWPYSGGIMSGCCNTAVDHAVLVVGFGEENGQKYWLIKNSWNAQWGEEGYIRLERGTNQCGITYQPIGAVVSGGPTPPPTPPTPPTPSPTPPPPTPTPTPSTTCPSDATLVSTAQGKECLWTNGTKGVLMPREPSEYCDYIAKGYFGYFWSKTQGTYNCPSSAKIGSNNQSYFCTWTDGEGDVHIPQGATADCGKLAQGRIGFVLSGVEALMI